MGQRLMGKASKLKVLPLVECGYCGKRKPPNEMKIGVVYTLDQKWSENKQRYQNIAVKQKQWYCRDGCHPDDRYGDELDE